GGDPALRPAQLDAVEASGLRQVERLAVEDAHPRVAELAEVDLEPDEIVQGDEDELGIAPVLGHLEALRDETNRLLGVVVVAGVKTLLDQCATREVGVALPLIDLEGRVQQAEGLAKCPASTARLRCQLADSSVQEGSTGSLLLLFACVLEGTFRSVEDLRNAVGISQLGPGAGAQVGEILGADAGSA